jgi:hypothetical protein
MWRDWLIKLDSRFKLASGAKDDVLGRAERALGVKFEDDLRELLHVANGVQGPESLLIPLWPVEEIALETLSRRNDVQLREYNMPMDHLVFIGSAGNGDLYAMGISATGVMKHDVFLWDHETDGRKWVAGNLRDYFKVLSEECAASRPAG